MGLSAADGSVRAQTSVRLSVSPLPGRDLVATVSQPVQRKMPELRACFGQAMSHNARVEGRVVIQLEAMGQRAPRTKVTSNETGDPKLAECMRKVLSSTDLRAAKVRDAGVLVAIDLRNPSASMRELLERNMAREHAVPVRKVPGGQIQSEAGTQGGEVRFELTTQAVAREALEQLHRDLKMRLSGLLDCRRKIARRARDRDGSISLDVSVNKGKTPKVKKSHSDLPDRTAAQCVAHWLEKANRDALSAAEVQLVVHYSR
jgi:hypothetical protein